MKRKLRKFSRRAAMKTGLMFAGVGVAAASGAAKLLTACSSAGSSGYGYGYGHQYGRYGMADPAGQWGAGKGPRIRIEIRRG